MQTRLATLGLLALGSWLLAAGCSGQRPPTRAPAAHWRERQRATAVGPDRPPSASDGVQYVDVTEQAGIRSTHFNGATGRRYLVETMGAGGAFLDYDGDGWLDVLLVNGKPLGTTDHRPPSARHPAPTAALYRNNRDGTLTDVTRGSGLDVPLYGMGCCVGDYDGDGDDDIYISCALEPSRLFRNDGSGRFRDVTAAAGVGNQSRLGTSCAWLDYDNDGRLDLFVCNYVRYSLATDHPCFEGGKRYYCRPTVYKPDTCALYHNRGNGTFEDVTKSAGIWNRTGNSLGVAVWDFDEDGWPEIVVANDLTPNYLFHNVPATTPRRRFEEVALDWGIALGENAQARAGMGIDVAEYRNDGHPAVLISNFTGEPLSFFTYDAPEQFTDIAFQVGVGEAHLHYLGFGAFFFDVDNNGDQDAFVGNGHIEPSIAQFGGGTTYGQRNHLYRNRGDGTYEEVGRSMGKPFAYERVTRGAAYGDYDNDGDLDLLVTNNGQPAELLRNDGGNRGHWLQLLLAGGGGPRQSNRNGIGARVTVRTGSVSQRQVVHSGSSYCSQSMLRLHFGLGAATTADEVEVRWPSGTIDRQRNLKADGPPVRVVEGSHSVPDRSAAGKPSVDPE